MNTVLTIVLIVTSIGMTILILSRKGTGDGLSSMFGGGAASTAAASSVSNRNLDRITISLALVWLAAIIGLGLMIKNGGS